MAKSNVKVTFLCPIEKVWNTVTNVSHYQWRSDIKRIDRIDENHFVEISHADIATYFTVTNKKEYELWEFTLENKNIKGHWTGKFYRHGDHTTLDFTENVSAKNIVMAPFIGKYLQKQQRQYFTDLKKELGCQEASYIPVF